jgi:hypothetical protein
MREDVLSILPFSFEQSRVPDAAQRFFAVHRRAGTYRGAGMDPGSAAHHFVLRRIRGTERRHELS